MKLKVCSLACLLLMVYSQLSPVYAQKASTEKDQQEQKVTLGTSEVLLDVVVRDKKGRPVKDLSANDFEIYEDGVKQKVESFQLYQRDAGEKTASPVAPSTNARVTPTAAPAQVHDPFAGVSVVALVFDRLSPEARELAHKAALKYVSSTLTQQDLTGVFAIDLSLHVLQPFTNNNELLRKAIDQASSASTSAFPSSQEEIAQLSDSLDSLEQQVSSTSSGSGGGATPNDPSSGAALAAARMSLNMAESFEILERDEQGYATTNGLIAIINSLKGIEGRKAIVFFSEGLAIPPAVVAHFKSVISDANRANVSVYSIDAAGLRVTSPLADSIRQTNSMGSRRMRSVQANEDTSGHPMSRDLERNEDFLRLNPDSGLASLADQTGGFLIADTNNLTNGLVRIDEDFRFHYVLSYV
ncbi:MAG TPA: VWA domain-containing protein, partial [Blastocatellia bacterium]|nr:VWA domain-containing protein [Blastocatellia bacterium]